MNCIKSLPDVGSSDAGFTWHEGAAGLVILAAAEFPIVGECCVTTTTHAIVTITHPRTRMGSGLVICT